MEIRGVFRRVRDAFIQVPPPAPLEPNATKTQKREYQSQIRQADRINAARKTTRRKIVGGVAATGALAGAAAIFGPQAIHRLSRQPEPTPQPESITTQETKDGKQFVAQALKELPSSPIKDLVNSKVLPFLEDSPPSSYDAAGVKVPVHGIKVKLEETDDDPALKGTFSQYEENTDAPLVTLTQDVSTSIPYIGLRKSTDNEPYSTAPDGTYLMPFANKTGDKMPDGISPVITVRNFSDLYMKKFGDEASQKLLKDRVKVVAVKESIQFAMIQIMAKLMVEKIRSLGLPTTVEIKRGDDSIDQVGFIANSIESLSSFKGRFLATMDAAATVVMIKAYSPQEINRILGNSTLGEATRELANVNLGTDENSILLNSLQWVLNNPAGQRIFHHGEFEKIP